MSSSNLTTSAILGDIARLISFNQIWNICLIAFGIFGHTLSICAFTRAPFRSNPCARYFLASTLSGCTVVYFIVPLRLLQTGYGIDVLIRSSVICKLLSYLFACFRVLPSYFILLASIDRYLCSSPLITFRRWSTLRVTRFTIPLTVLVIFIIHVHVPFNYEIIFYPQRWCIIVTSTYQIFLAVWNLLIWSWIPNSLMLMFGCLTIRHVHQSKRRIEVENNRSDAAKHSKKIDRQLMRMLILQCFVLVSTITVGSFCQLYVTFVNNKIQSDLERSRNISIGYTGTAIANFSPVMSFYLFTLSSQLFRRQLIGLVRRRPLAHNVAQTNSIRRPRVN